MNLQGTKRDLSQIDYIRIGREVQYFLHQFKNQQKKGGLTPFQLFIDLSGFLKDPVDLSKSSSVWLS